MLLLLLLSRGIPIIIFKRCSNTPFQQEKLAFITFVLILFKTSRKTHCFKNSIIHSFFMSTEVCRLEFEYPIRSIIWSNTFKNERQKYLYASSINLHTNNAIHV